MITIICPSRYKLNNKALRKHVKELLVSENIPANAGLNIAFIGTRKMKQIASQYKNEDVALPVLAFDYHDNPTADQHLLGEVIVCYPQAVLLAAERNKRVEDMIWQLVDHGIKNIL